MKYLIIWNIGNIRVTKAYQWAPTSPFARPMTFRRAKAYVENLYTTTRTRDAQFAILPLNLPKEMCTVFIQRPVASGHQTRHPMRIRGLHWTAARPDNREESSPISEIRKTATTELRSAQTSARHPSRTSPFLEQLLTATGTRCSTPHPHASFHTISSLF